MNCEYSNYSFQMVTKNKNPEKKDTPTEKQLFDVMNDIIDHRQLFCQPHFTRKDMLKLTGLDKNRFGNMMRRYSGVSNCTVYINAKRIQLAAQLIVERPDTPIKVIAIDCGMSNIITFNRLFKETFGMTPTQYHKQQTT